MNSDRIILTRVWTDHEIIGRFYLQACRLQVQNYFPESEKNEFFRNISALMHKLHATRYHLENYKKIEIRELKAAQKGFKKHPNETREAFDLIFELEAFLFQVKSSLDMLVKLLNPIIGRALVSTKTYEKKGESIIKGLEQLKNKKNSRKEEIDQLIKLIRSDKDSWIETVVDYRDELNHFKGLNNFKFIPRQLRHNQIIAEKPRFKGSEVVSFMQTIYRNNIEFSHDFVCVALSIRMRTGIYLGADTEENALKYFDNMPSAKFVKYCWYLKTNRKGAAAEQGH